jgi:glycosyltransferase involved in cell wall biosynthesis
MGGTVPRQRLRSFRNYRPFARLLEVLRSARRAASSTRRKDYRQVRLAPEGKPRGRVLLSFRVRALLEPDMPLIHHNYWESAAIARVWRDLGFVVDVVDNDHHEFVLTHSYDFLVGSRIRLEDLARQCNPDCVKVLHIDTAHWLFSNTASHTRALDLQRRRGVTLTRIFEIGRNRAIEVADCATALGNDVTVNTYAYAGKPIFRIPSKSAPRLFDWPEDRDFEAARKHFVWFGSRGALHKGLDLVLDAFAAMPDLRLTVAGPIRERDFEDAYRTELYGTDNIRSIGWVDLAGPAFPDLARNAVALVYPSCAEGQSGGVIAAMHAGLIPIVSGESGVDVDPSFGIRLPDCSIRSIQAAVRELSDRPAVELERMGRKAWEFARANHTRERFVEEYRKVAAELVSAYS